MKRRDIGEGERGGKKIGREGALDPSLMQRHSLHKAFATRVRQDQSLKRSLQGLCRVGSYKPETNQKKYIEE